MKITEVDKENICKISDEAISSIENMITELKGIIEEFDKYDKSLGNYYRVWSARESISDAKVRLEAAKIRLSELKEEAESLELSTSGFY